MSASFSSTSITPAALLVAAFPYLNRAITLLSGENRTAGALLGKITLGAATSAAKSGGNTGNGTLVLDVTTPILANAHLSGAGVYTARCIAVPTTHASIWEVRDPFGVSLGQVAISGSGGTGTFANRIKFVITDAGTDFIVGDGFDITIAAGSGKYKLSLAAAVDGSQEPDAILAVDTDATSADVATSGYFVGGFDGAQLTLGTGHTVASIKEALRKKNIHLVDVATTY